MRDTYGGLIAKTDRDIEKFGWSAIGVFPSVDDPPSIPFMYTIGLHSLDEHPELLVMGLPRVVAHTVLGILYDKVKGGLRLSHDQRVDGVLQHYDVCLREIPSDGRPANMARLYYGTDNLPVLQVFWPDVEGRFPWEEDCDASAVEDQDIRKELE
jgi:hypothetical protein